MLTKALEKLWKLVVETPRGQRHSYIVYAPSEKIFAGFELTKDYSPRVIDKIIADLENKNRRTEHKAQVRRHSINYVQVDDCASFREAREKARIIKKLKYEDPAIVLERYTNTAIASTKQTESLGETFSSPPKKISGLDFKQP